MNVQDLKWLSEIQYWKELDAFIEAPEQKAKQEYWVLAFIKWTTGDKRNLKTFFFSLDDKQANELIKNREKTPLLATCLYYVNNHTGEFREIWTLPKDISGLIEMVKPAMVPRIVQAARTLPVFN